MKRDRLRTALQAATPNVESELRFYATFWAGFGALALYAAHRPGRETLLRR